MEKIKSDSNLHDWINEIIWYFEEDSKKQLSSSRKGRDGQVQHEQGWALHTQKPTQGVSLAPFYWHTLKEFLIWKFMIIYYTRTPQMWWICSPYVFVGNCHKFLTYMILSQLSNSKLQCNRIETHFFENTCFNFLEILLSDFLVT